MQHAHTPCVRSRVAESIKAAVTLATQNHSVSLVSFSFTTATTDRKVCFACSCTHTCTSCTCEASRRGSGLHELGESDVPRQEAQRAVYRTKLQDQLRVGNLPGVWKSTNTSSSPSLHQPADCGAAQRSPGEQPALVPLRRTSSMETLMSLELMALFSTERQSC